MIPIGTRVFIAYLDHNIGEGIVVGHGAGARNVMGRPIHDPHVVKITRRGMQHPVGAEVTFTGNVLCYNPIVAMIVADAIMRAWLRDQPLDARDVS